MRLSNCFLDVFSFAEAGARLRESNASHYREEVTKRLAAALGYCHASELEIARFERAKFAVIAWVDEMAATATWGQDGSWMANSLQMEHFRTATAGVEFYARLEELAPSENDIREVYCLCLGLGFLGQFYAAADQTVRDQCLMRHLDILLRQGGHANILDETVALLRYADTAHIRPPAVERRTTLAQRLALMVVPIAFAGAVYLALSFALHGTSNEVGKLISQRR
ncbi:DotU family type IV/VI secretion system protein [Cupriavidus sp. D39]|uniref:DotU family type IV/VI secretion system protein n=1 Tax=Cupriavidus sp. D39 TaxID=2997877 RepID=UPI00226F3C86|nr:DotU family type IV/VI secretion system protein [Cupriavidus sp. D39]MCY0858666.1 DotU family type IV/VI secretion system protein [Cupriavidus sp. D39]